ncbi:hypothetical protein BDZ89DRAFT_120044 [Hymenopellis radicata]|nr:hypothetical protein BDZ89DRAFT_120044 [Hymenopellis radicata]
MRNAPHVLPFTIRGFLSLEPGPSEATVIDRDCQRVAPIVLSFFHTGQFCRQCPSPQVVSVSSPSILFHLQSKCT